MGFKIGKVHHADHGISQEVMQLLVDMFKPTEGFFRETRELPSHVPDVVCGIYGPNMGDEPVPESDVVYKQRTPDRPMSRMVKRPGRPTRLVTIIGVVNKGEETLPKEFASEANSITIFTCYGGNAAEREPGDKSLVSPNDIETARDFWSKHALVLGD